MSGLRGITRKRAAGCAGLLALIVALLVVALKTDAIPNDGEWVELWWPVIFVPFVVGAVYWYFRSDPHNIRGGGRPRDKGGKP